MTSLIAAGVRMMAKISRLCLLVALVLLVWCGLWAFTTQQDQDTDSVLIVEGMERDLGEQSVGPCMLEVRVRNTGSRPHRIIGISNG